jgi:hypothetical protein
MVDNISNRFSIDHTVLCGYLAWDILSNRQKLSNVVVAKPDTTIQIKPTPPVIADTSITQETPEVTRIQNKSQNLFGAGS